MNPCPKPVHFRSPKLLAFAKEAPHCMNCHKPNHGDIVAAHSNSQTHGKWMGLKAEDFPAYLCGECHDRLDGRSGTLTRFEKRQMFTESMCETFRWLLREGYLVTR